MSEIAVFGSINLDLILKVDSFPKPGQTVKAQNFKQMPGGKGANQAVAAAKLGGEVSMYGLLGEDSYADRLESSLSKAGVNTSEIEIRSSSSGLAVVTVDSSGENEIIIMPGANELIDEEYVKSIANNVSDAEILLLQLEVPINSITSLLELLSGEGGPKVILDPAPAVPLEDLPLAEIDILTPNESELNTLIKGSEVEAGIDKLLNSGLDALVLKKGEKGCEYISRHNHYSVPSFNVTSVDTTGAGDTFNGALAVAMTKKQSMKEALEFANAAGACATMEEGAQPSIPDLSKVLKCKN